MRSFCILCSRCYDHSTVFLIRKTNRVALAGILFAVILSQTNPVFTKLLLKEEWTPLGMYFLALLVMAIVLALHEFMLLEAGEKWEMDRRDIKGTLLTTLTGGILAPILFLNGLRFVQASEAVLISSLSPLFIVMFAVCMLQERFNRNMFVGAAFLLAGTVVLLWKDAFQAELSLGVPLVLFSSLASALTTTLHKKYVRHRHLDSVVLVRTFLSLAVIGIIIALTEPETFQMLREPPSIWLVLGLAIVSYILPYFLYFRALAKISTLDAGIIVASAPGIGILMAVAFLGEQVSPVQLASLGLMAFGIFFINVPLTKLRIMPSRLMEIGPLRR